MDPATALAALALAICAEPLAAAQGGYAEEKHPGLGLEFPMARNYVPVPVEPTEKWIVLYYAGRPATEAERERNADRGIVTPWPAQLRIVDIDYVPDPSPVTGESVGPPEPPEPPEATGDGGDAPPAAKAREKEKPPPPPINTFERWLEREFPTFGSFQVTPGKKRGAYQGNEHALLSTAKDEHVSGWAYAWVADQKRTVALVGLCAPAEFDEQVKIWRYIAERVEIADPEERSLEKLERLYAKKALLDVPYRIKIRSQLVRGWKAEDTPNYIVVFSTKDEPLIRAIKVELEAVRAEYERLYPPVKPIETVSTVRVCRDRDEYFQYGGPAGTGGYWNSAAQELVFYDYENVGKIAGTGKADSRIVLYHEAFHQFIHYSCGELAPHSWFNEGTGDYFSGAKIAGGKVRRIGVNPWRIRYVQAALEAGLSIPWSEILAFEQAEFYRPDRRGMCYAQAWAEKRAREAALAKAFEGIDIATLEIAWRQYTLSLEAD
jgi:hypothetical protein